MNRVALVGATAVVMCWALPARNGATPAFLLAGRRVACSQPDGTPLKHLLVGGESTPCVQCRCQAGLAQCSLLRCPAIDNNRNSSHKLTTFCTKYSRCCPSLCNRHHQEQAVTPPSNQCRLTHQSTALTFHTFDHSLHRLPLPCARRKRRLLVTSACHRAAASFSVVVQPTSRSRYLVRVNERTHLHLLAGTISEIRLNRRRVKVARALVRVGTLYAFNSGYSLRIRLVESAVEIEWDGERQLRVRVGEGSGMHLCGFCGNRNGRAADEEAMFANAARKSRQCRRKDRGDGRLLALANTKALKKMKKRRRRRRRAWQSGEIARAKRCALLKSESCSGVAFRPFFRSCLMARSDRAQCRSLELYARECDDTLSSNSASRTLRRLIRRAGCSPSAKRRRRCRLGSGQVWSSCADACRSNSTCTTMAPSSSSCPLEACTSACVCPAAMVLDRLGGRCVYENECDNVVR